MAKVATALTLSIIDLTKALVAKKTPRYANVEKWGIYSFEDVIYPQARLAFPEYNKLYDSNEEFTNYFVKDLNKKDSRLVKILGEKNVEKILIGDQAVGEGQVSNETSEQSAGAAVSDQTPTGESPSTMTGGMPFPAMASGKISTPRIIRTVPQVVEKETPTSKLVTGARNITSPGWLKTFGSNAQIFAKKNLGRIGRGLGEIAKGVGRGITGPMLNGAYKGLGKVGGGGLDAIGRLSSPGLRGASRSFASSGSKRLVWGLVGTFLVLVVGIGFIGGPSGTTPGGAAPISTSNLLDYSIPFRDSSVTVADPDEVKKRVLARWPNAKLENWDIIVSESIKNGWNPAFVLALWIEETGAQGEPSYSDPLGCAPNQPTTDINLSLSCLFNNFQSYTNEQFEQFMLRYSEGFSGTAFTTNPNFPPQIKDWYSKLVPSGVGALTLISTQTAEALGCPTIGTITNPYGHNIPGQPSDIDYYGCGTLLSCHSGIDIAYGWKTSVSTTFDGVVTTVNSEDVKGKYVTISNSQTGYSATFEHLDSQIVSVGEIVKRGQVIGTMGSTGAAGGVHLHYRLERNNKVINPFRYLGSSGLIATISLTQSDDIGANNYLGKPESSDWGRCNQVP